MIKRLSLIISIALMILIASCGEEQSGSSVSEQDQRAVLTNIGNNIIVPSYRLLRDESARLSVDFQTFKSDLTVENLLELRASLKEVRLAWQWCNFYDFGPASDEGLGSIMNTFPIDKGAIENNIDEGNFVVESVARADERGFAAIGYLIHGDGSTDSEIVQQFIDEENRVIYLEQLVDQINTKAITVDQKWTENSEGYLSTFTESTGTSVGSSLSLLTNAMTRTFERKTRDGKIGIPVGLRTLGVPVPNAVEALYAGYSVELAQENMKAYQNLFKGQSLREGDAPDRDGESFISYLTALGNADLASDIESGFDKSIAAVNALNEPYQEEVVNNPTPSNTAIAEIQQLIVMIKSEMTSAMGISITFQDNDGD